MLNLEAIKKNTAHLGQHETIVAMADEIERLREYNKPFPMIDGPPITWFTARLIFKVYGSGQTLERIAERGGFGWGEVKLMCERYKHDYGRNALDELWSPQRTEKS